MAPDPLGGGVDDDVGAEVDGPAGVAGGAEGVVHHERDAVVVGDLGQGLEVGHVEARVADRLDVQGAGARVDGLGEVLRVVSRDELRADAEPGKGDLELVVGAPVQVAGGDDVVAVLKDRGESQELRGLAARGGEGRGSAFEGGDPLLEDVRGRVHDPGVDVPELLEREEARPVVGVVEGVRRRLVDRDGAGVRPGGGLLPGVDLQGLETVALLLVAHRPLLHDPPRRVSFRFRWPAGNKKPAPAQPLRVSLATVTLGCRSG